MTESMTPMLLKKLMPHLIKSDLKGWDFDAQNCQNCQNMVK